MIASTAALLRDEGREGREGRDGRKRLGECLFVGAGRKRGNGVSTSSDC